MIICSAVVDDDLLTLSSFMHSEHRFDLSSKAGLGEIVSRTSRDSGSEEPRERPHPVGQTNVTAGGDRWLAQDSIDRCRARQFLCCRTSSPTSRCVAHHLSRFGQCFRCPWSVYWAIPQAWGIALFAFPKAGRARSWNATRCLPQSGQLRSNSPESVRLRMEFGRSAQFVVFFDPSAPKLVATSANVGQSVARNRPNLGRVPSMSAEIGRN